VSQGQVLSYTIVFTTNFDRGDFRIIDRENSAGGLGSDKGP